MYATFPGSMIIHCDYVNNSEAPPHTQLHCVSVNANILSIKDLGEIFMNKLNPVSCSQ